MSHTVVSGRSVSTREGPILAKLFSPRRWHPWSKVCYHGDTHKQWQIEVSGFNGSLLLLSSSGGCFFFQMKIVFAPPRAAPSQAFKQLFPSLQFKFKTSSGSEQWHETCLHVMLSAVVFEGLRRRSNCVFVEALTIQSQKQAQHTAVWPLLYLPVHHQ